MAAAASTVQGAGAVAGAHFTPAGADPRGVEGGGLTRESPAARPSWVRRKRAAFKDSVWAPVALKILGLVLGMVALASVGVASILCGTGGVQVPLEGMLSNDIHAAWLADKPAASASRAGAPAREGGLVAAQNTAPIQSDTASSSAAAPGVSSGVAGAGLTEEGKVILNAASIEDLRRLPGVGPKRAEAILALRTRLGHFKHVNDLLRVKGIGVKGLKKILPHVVLDGPKPSA